MCSISIDSDKVVNCYMVSQNVCLMAFDCKTESKLIHYICIYVEIITMSHIYLRLYFQFIYALFVSGGKKNEQMPLTEIVCLFFLSQFTFNQPLF